MGDSSFLVPADDVLCCETDREHQELQIEPVRFEPKEEINAENDGEGPKPECICVSSRPAHKHVERIGEEQLSQEKIDGVVDGTPIPPPIQHYEALSTSLHVVLFLENHIQGQPA